MPILPGMANSLTTMFTLLNSSPHKYSIHIGWINKPTHELLNRWTMLFNHGVISGHTLSRCPASWKAKQHIHWLFEFAQSSNEREAVIIPIQWWRDAASLPRGTQPVWHSWDLNLGCQIWRLSSKPHSLDTSKKSAHPCAPGRQLNQRTFGSLSCFESLARASPWGLTKA
jgi:hypothetical protein